MNLYPDELSKIRQLIKEAKATYGMELVFVGGRDQVRFKIYDKKPKAHRITNNIQSKAFTLRDLIAAHDYYNFVSNSHWYFVKRKDFDKYCSPDSFKIEDLEEVCVKEFIL
jgi:hypothetical protein